MAASVLGSEEEKETGRIEAFSDGIFGIAITLLILNIKVPKAADIQGKITLLAALGAQWPAYLSYLNSFLTVLIMWMNHHKLFRHIRRSDHLFLLLNGLLLMGVTIVPFPTAVLAEYINTPEARTAAAVYSGSYLVIAILFYIMWRYASSARGLLARNHDRESVSAISRQYRFGPLMYLIAFVLAFISVWASVGLCIALAIFFALPGVTAKPNELIKSPSGKRIAREAGDAKF
jgi:uncharacterized membrane protein